MLDDENTVEVQEGSVREALLQSFASSKKDDTPAATDAPADKTAPPPPKDDKPAAPVSKDDKAAPAAAKAAEAEKPLEPPARWTKTQKEWFAKLDRDSQGQLLELNKEFQSGFTKKTMEAAQLQQRLSAIDNMLAPRREGWQRQGWDDARALNMLFAYWDLAQRDPMAFIQNFAQERGMDLARMFAPQQLAGQRAAPGAAYESPSGELPQAVAQELGELRRQNQVLFQQVNQLTGVLDRRAQSEQTQLKNELSAELDAFQSATDANGSLLYPFFPDVKADMAYALSTGRASSLKDAYELATRINSSVYAKVEESRDIERRRADEQRRADEAERAKRAGSSVSSTTTYTPPPAADDDDTSIRGLLKRGFESARGGTPRI